MARRRGNKWQADVVIDGKRKRPSFDTKEAAENFERLAALGEGVSKQETLSAFVDEQYDRIWGDNRRKDFVDLQLSLLYRVIPKDTLLINISTRMVDDAVTTWINQGLSGSTINHRLSTLSKILKRALHLGVIPSLPVIQRQKGSGVRERTLEKCEELSAYTFFEHAGLMASRWITQFLLYTGARTGETWALTRSSVQAGWVTFRRGTTKNGETRTVPLAPKAQEAWDELCKMSNLDRPFEIAPRRTYRDHFNLFREHVGATNDKDFVPHMLRHTCATRLVTGGVPLPQVMKWLGHKSLQVTLRYTNIMPRDLDIAVKVLTD